MITISKKIKFFQSCFGENYNLARDGVNVAFKCPACGKGTEKLKFSINLDTYVCHCWVCDIKGKTPFYIIKKHVSSEHANTFKKEFSGESVSPDDDESDDIVSFPTKFKMFACLADKKIVDPDTRDCLKYLKNRGVTHDLLWRHKIGTFVGRRWSRRVVFPSFDENQRLNFYVSRTIDSDGFPKYLNCKADKTKIIFDEMRISWNQELMITEGVFDMIKCQFNTTCLLGSSLSSNHKLFQQIVINKTPILLALDADMQGKTFNIAKNLSSYGVSVRILDLGGYSDVGSMPVEIVRQKSKSAPIYSRESRLHHLIGTISSGSLF